jgi:hypothetical protein
VGAGAGADDADDAVVGSGDGETTEGTEDTETGEVYEVAPLSSRVRCEIFPRHAKIFRALRRTSIGGPNGNPPCAPYLPWFPDEARR